MSNPVQRKKQVSLGTPDPQQVGNISSDWADALLKERPDLSAATPLYRWQKFTLWLLFAVATSTFAFDPKGTASALMILLTPAFLFVAALRGFAAVLFVSRDKLPPAGAALPDDQLPVYSILVPLYREAHMATGLIAALDRLDWPKDKRDVVFITEADDDATRGALITAIGGRLGMRILAVPAGEPRTKPRALMFALPVAVGDYVVVFDAEDEPDIGQLKAAFRHFLSSDAKVACLQGRLNVYNPGQNWITRQFTLEYTALFDAVLPALQHLRLPLPLGGTSNHFRREVFEVSGGWDPYNVTEDADLGVRLARMGWRVEMLDSTTWEEAPPRLSLWLGQRTRWLKGWMQTSLVHLRHPLRLWRELGAGGFFGVSVVLGGILLSALIHPLVYAYALASLYAGDISIWPPEGWAGFVWWLGAANLLFAHIVGIILCYVTTARRHSRRLAMGALLIPIYWMLISIAAYRALFELVQRPFHWRKTEHSSRQPRV